MDLRGLFRRFRTWQQTTPVFECKSRSTHKCANCGNTFDGDYCPVCGQRYDVGRPTWGSIIDDLRFKNGIDAGSVITFILHMLGRPGYMMGEFLKGRRRTCADPFNVLCYAAIFALLILNIFKGGDSEVDISVAGGNALMQSILGWMTSHLEWTVIIETALLIVPTWLLFRYAPRHPFHTFPDGFYIQIFMGSLVLLFIVLRSLVANWLIVLVPIYYFIAYRQLFGYGFFGTLWRTMLCFGVVFYFFGISMAVGMRLSGEFWAQHTTWEFLSMFGAFLLLGVGILFLGYWISKISSPKPVTASAQ